MNHFSQSRPGGLFELYLLWYHGSNDQRYDETSQLTHGVAKGVEYATKLTSHVTVRDEVARGSDLLQHGRQTQQDNGTDAVDFGEETKENGRTKSACE